MPAAEHPTFKPPANADVPIWRYMTLSKFVWLLQRRALYFARSDLLGDPFEGYYTKPMVQLEDAFVGGQLSDPEFAKIPNAEKRARENFHLILGSKFNFRETFFVNCWHMNDEESLAMWRLYAANDESICIQSTYRTLHSLLPDSCFLGRITYIDYTEENIELSNVLNYIVHKRKTFEHEKELRAVIWSPSFDKLVDGQPIKPNTDRESIILPIDISQLVKAVYISPNAEPILQDIVANLISTYGLDAPVRKSAVMSPPDYLIKPSP